MIKTAQSFNLWSFRDQKKALAKFCEVEEGVSMAQVYKSSQLFFIVKSDSPSVLSIVDVAVKPGYARVKATLKYEEPILDLKVVDKYVVVALSQLIAVYDFESEDGMNSPLRKLDDCLFVSPAEESKKDETQRPSGLLDAVFIEGQGLNLAYPARNKRVIVC